MDILLVVIVRTRNLVLLRSMAKTSSLFIGFYNWLFNLGGFFFFFFLSLLFSYLQQFHLGSLHMHIPYLVYLA